jgi:hypothetical protein
LCWHIPPPRAGLQPLGSGLSISSDDFDSVGELYLEDDFWQLRPDFHKKWQLRSVIVFKSGVLFRRVVLFLISGKGNFPFQPKFFGSHFDCDHQKGRNCFPCDCVFTDALTLDLKLSFLMQPVSLLPGLQAAHGLSLLPASSLPPRKILSDCVGRLVSPAGTISKTLSSEKPANRVYDLAINR